MERIFIYGHYGRENLGDDIMLFGLLGELHDLFPDATFSIFAPKEVEIPQDLLGRVRWIRRSILKVTPELGKCSDFIVGGGTMINDFGTARKFLRPLVLNFFFVALAKALKNNVHFIGVGVGPLDKRWGGRIAYLIFKLCDSVSVRDDFSIEVLRKIGIRSRISKGFDLTALAMLESTNKYNLVHNKIPNNKILGVSLVPVYADYFQDNSKDMLLTKEVAKALNAWLKYQQVDEIRLFAFFLGDKKKPGDILLLRYLKNLLIPLKTDLIIYNGKNPFKEWDLLASCDIMLTMRYHSAVLCYLSGVPQILIGYHPKCFAFAKEIGLPDSVVISVQEVLDGYLERKLLYFEKHLGQFSAKLPIQVAIDRAGKVFDF